MKIYRRTKQRGVKLKFIAARLKMFSMRKGMNIKERQNGFSDRNRERHTHTEKEIIYTAQKILFLQIRNIEIERKERQTERERDTHKEITYTFRKD